jgi:hypothetical protein
VLPLDEWLHVLKTNWSHYEAEQIKNVWVCNSLCCAINNPWNTYNLLNFF